MESIKRTPVKIFSSLVFLGEFRQRLLPRDNILATVQEGNRGKTAGQRRVVINHARLSDKVAVQQQVLCPLRGCESEERERGSRERVAWLINPTDINGRESRTTLVRQAMAGADYKEFEYLLWLERIVT